MSETVFSDWNRGYTPIHTGCQDIQDEWWYLGSHVSSEQILRIWHKESFGMDFGPVSGNLWDSENGPFYGDEINIVEPGFNSGWSKVQGLWRPTKYLTAGELELNPSDLVTFNHRGKYSSPQFTWKEPVGPIVLKFLNSPALGEENEDDLLVGDINNGYLYHFELIKNRTAFDLDDKAGVLTN